MNSVRVGAPGNSSLRAAIFKITISLKIMQTVRRKEGAVRMGQEGAQGPPEFQDVCRGLKAGLWLPLFRQTLQAILKQPKVCANLGWVRMLLEI